MSSQNFVPTIVMNSDGSEEVVNVPVMSINETNAFSASINSVSKSSKIDIIRNKLKGFKPKVRRDI